MEFCLQKFSKYAEFMISSTKKHKPNSSILLNFFYLCGDTKLPQKI